MNADFILLFSFFFSFYTLLQMTVDFFVFPFCNFYDFKRNNDSYRTYCGKVTINIGCFWCIWLSKIITSRENIYNCIT